MSNILYLDATQNLIGDFQSLIFQLHLYFLQKQWTRNKGTFICTTESNAFWKSSKKTLFSFTWRLFILRAMIAELIGKTPISISMPGRQAQPICCHKRKTARPIYKGHIQAKLHPRNMRWMVRMSTLIMLTRPPTLRVRRPALDRRRALGSREKRRHTHLNKQTSWLTTSISELNDATSQESYSHYYVQWTTFLHIAATSAPRMRIPVSQQTS